MNKDERLKKVKDILPRVKEVLLGIYGDRVVDVVLYGSFAKNAFTEDSDIDVAVVFKRKVNKAEEIDRIYDSLYDLELETEELISVNPISLEEFENSVWPLFYHIKTEGVRI